MKVQVRVLDSLSNVSSVTLGAPAHKRAKDFMNYHRAEELSRDNRMTHHFPGVLQLIIYSLTINKKFNSVRTSQGIFHHTAV